MTVSKANLSVAEMLQLARDVKAGIVTCQYMLAPAVIELLETPWLDECVSVGCYGICCFVERATMSPTEARGLAVALLRAADEAEK